ncbi:MAG: flagellar assembly peptidoglycan hydrolase FlgJ [Polaromonas sp.]|uniref:flagellar assembly peptidoglycan hydrolase FlgJ n=1 Tax=Polaromonas sp. TaxID=1869339 RepID=UPI00271A6364|nr:flagellar assembly peptidoglycan hydrolase FlgJ [Polaromonas sp.]MDO9116307.1 flagellar assembly peptidoglycan hydrolase FlgJ [Polaromonas sp.]MDP1887966.1 flagellar assembly peptidoglycan hydrolase FlgJ [Polaromonas sp.]
MNSAGLANLNSMNSPAAGVLDQRLSLDVQGVDALRRTVRSSPQEGMKQASKQFEVMFMQMVLKSMREATPSDGMFSSQQEKMYTSMLDQQLAQNLSGRGLGLAEAMFAQLNRTAGGADVQPAAVPADKPPGLSGAAVSRAPQPVASAAAPLVRTPDLSLYETATAQATLSRSALPQAHVEQFVSRMLPAAQRASEATGVPAQLIMAQAALESGWGRREIRAEDGQTSYNVFGIKADKSWKGPVVETMTTEYVNGVAQKGRASFRAYGSYDEAFSDYARFLVTNPRYANVLSTQDPSEAAHGLQRAGYATDPQYGGKLVRIMKQMS